MNPIVLSFADGTAFFVGLALSLIASLLLLRFRVGAIRGVMSVLAIAGILLVLISATPWPSWVYAGWLFFAAGALVAGNIAACPKKVLFGFAGLLSIMVIALMLAELPFRRMPHITVSKGATIYVLGDSISAGMGTKEKCWPEVLRDNTQLSVINLAQPGATVQSAFKQSEGIAESNALVIVEIGGNDMISGTDAATFRDQLDLLLASLRLRHHRVVMLELPLFPFLNAFGRAQRELAKKYGVSLLPKHCFATVLGTECGTLDGLHLSQGGHNTMAGIMAGVIQEK